MDIKISKLTENEIPDFCLLVREVYDEFVAPDYPEEGNEHFYTFLTKEAVSKRMNDGALTLCARADGIMAGVCAFRDKTHLSTFFVKKQFHGRGIGRMMFDFSLEEIKKKYPESEVVSVFSSPFALPVYKRLGFIQTDERQQKDGIIFFPMEYRIVP